MFDKVEAYHRPANVREALELLHDGKGRARIVAGATDLTQDGDHSARILIDITRAGLKYIRTRGHGIAIGATTTMTELEESAEIRGFAGGLLAKAAATCGSVQIRNMATVGGNLANGSPAAELTTALLALDAMVVLAEDSGKRKLPLREYLDAPRLDALLVEVTLPEPPGGSRCGWSFQKFARTAVDISIVNVAAGMQLDARGRVKWVRLALGAVAPAPMRAIGVEELMTGHALDHALLAQACEEVMREVVPTSDIRASAEYRREISRVLAGRALEECAAEAGYSL